MVHILDYGGSGGGAGNGPSNGDGGSATVGQGNDGGDRGPSYGGTSYTAAGGGGAGAAGANGDDGGGNGGNGLANTITGSSVTYAGGGGWRLFKRNSGLSELVVAEMALTKVTQADQAAQILAAEAEVTTMVLEALALVDPLVL